MSIELSKKVKENIIKDANALYDELNEKAQEVDSYDFGLPMANRQTQPIVDCLSQYAEKWQAAEAKAERYVKLIEQLNNQVFIKGVLGATWGETEYDSMAAAAGFNQAIMNMKSMILKALTPKTSTDGTE